MEVSDEQLRAAVAASRSWRGVLREVGRTSPRVGRLLRARCDELGIDYGHFSSTLVDDSQVRAAVKGAGTWNEAIAAAGYTNGSGSARSALRRRCAELGLDVSHLEPGPVPARRWQGVEGTSRQHLRSAAPMLLAGALTLAGHRVMWPLEPAPYDLLVDAGSTLQRVQVKSTTVRENGSWKCYLTRSSYDPERCRQVRSVYVPGEIDTFGLVDGDLGMYLVPYDAVAGRTAVALSAYEAFRLPVRPAGTGSASSPLT